MEEYIILRTGYNQAINDILETLNNNIYIDEENKRVLKDMILRKQRQYLIGNAEYEGFLYKHYDEQNKIGYILFDDIYELKGVAIFIEDGTCKELPEKELIYARNAFPVVWCDTFKNKDLINLKYEELTSKWKKI
jgi:hypothetical protein